MLLLATIHKTIELFRVEKTFKISKSNRSPALPSPALPCSALLLYQIPTVFFFHTLES